MPRRSLTALTAPLALSAAFALVAVSCSPGSGVEEDDDRTVVTFRLWDDQVAQAYETSFAEFEDEHDDIRVEIEQVPWSDYFDKLTVDVGGGNAPDIFWTNTSNFGLFADNGNLLNIDEHLGDQKAEWKESVVDLYTRDGTLWGVPQLWDSIGLFYNAELTGDAGVDPSALRWDPDGEDDTFLPAARSLTVDAEGRTADDDDFDPAATEQYGFNAAYDAQAVFWNFVGSNGGVWQNGDSFAYNNPTSIEAMRYVVDLINTEQVAPPAADTNDDTDRTRDLFIAGQLALFQSGPYSLKAIEEGADFDWEIAPMLEGPAGRVGVVHGVAAMAAVDPETDPEASPETDPETSPETSMDADDEQLRATVEVLEWIGSAEGQRPIAEGGYAFPGVTAMEQDYVDYWAEKGVDVTPFLQSAEPETVPAPVGPRVQAGMAEAEPILQEMFRGDRSIADAMDQAEERANEARAQ